MAMLVKPCASVSWISAASRSRSATTPAAWWAAASSSCAEVSSPSSTARSRLWSMSRRMKRPSATLNAAPTSRDGAAVRQSSSERRSADRRPGRGRDRETERCRARRRVRGWRAASTGGRARRAARRRWLDRRGEQQDAGGDAQVGPPALRVTVAGCRRRRRLRSRRPERPSARRRPAPSRPARRGTWRPRRRSRIAAKPTFQAGRLASQTDEGSTCSSPSYRLAHRVSFAVRLAAVAAHPAERAYGENEAHDQPEGEHDAHPRRCARSPRARRRPAREAGRPTASPAPST